MATRRSTSLPQIIPVLPQPNFQTASNHTMGVLYSKSKASSPEEDYIVYSQSPLTRIRIFPQSNLQPVTQDVHLPTNATSSLDSLCTFINTLSIMKLIPDHKVFASSFHLLFKNESVPETFTTESDGSGAQFSSRMDHIWMTHARCVISVAAKFNGSTSTDVAEIDPSLTAKAFKSIKMGKEAEDDEQATGEDANRFSKEGKTEVIDVTTNIEQTLKVEEAFPQGDDDGIGAKEAVKCIEPQMVGQVKPVKREENQEPKSQKDSPLHEKPQHGPELHREHLQARLSSLCERRSQELNKNRPEDFELGKDAGSVLSLESLTKSELATQAKPLQSTAAESSVHDETAQKQEEKARLQRELQSRMTNSLVSRGKPTTSKSTTYKTPVGAKTSGEAFVSRGEPSRTAIRVDKASAFESDHIQGGVYIHSHARQPYRPFTNEDWIMGRLRENIPEADGEDAI